MTHEQVYRMPFAKIYALLMAKAVKKGRSEAEVDRVIAWLTGYSAEQLHQLAQSEVDYGSFFTQAPALHPHRQYITGTVCGVRVETVEEPLMREMRRLDKLIDELAKGRPLERILRTPPAR